MSRLDSFIRRLEAQRACLEFAAAAVRELPGPVLELGLGNGRTYDHLREILPGREIYVFERHLAAHPACLPDPDHLLLGDLQETLPAAARRLPGLAAMVHSDVGTGDQAANAELAAFVACHLPPLMAVGSLLVADQPMADARLLAQAPPAGVPPGRYFLYRRATE